MYANSEQQIETILQEYFGYSTFKEGQKAIIDQIIKGHDVLAIMPTGAGKSICYQVPALYLQGTTIVISPLISLMKDQVDSLVEMGVKAAFINSSLTSEELFNISAEVRSGACRLLYVAPERLELDSFNKLITAIDVRLVAVDEAHCISQWGHDFRPAYRKIKAMISALPKRPPVAAFTATATPQVKNDIVALLEMRRPFSLATGFDRENLCFEIEKPADKFAYLANFLESIGPSSGIIYCSTRNTVERVSSRLNKLGYPCTLYHAGLSEIERIENQEAFIKDKIPVVVATVAFGMGIDKSNIRYVIHYNMPKTMENYYQEAGRAGRDSEAARCILLYSPADIITNKKLIGQPNDLAFRKGEYKKLQDMIDYCHTDDCLRGFILQYFGEIYTPEKCANCSNCINTYERTDITVEAQKIISCIKRTGERFGSGLVADVLRGAKTLRVNEMGFERLSTYGLMSEYSKMAINEMISFLVARGLVDVSGGQYPVLSLNRTSYAWLKSGEQLTIKRLTEVKKSKTSPCARIGSRAAGLAAKDELSSDQQALFEKLRQLRRDTAVEKNVPPYVVFSDATLYEMCRKQPTDENTLLGISGVGKYKLEKYGACFIKTIKAHTNNGDGSHFRYSYDTN